MPARSDDHAADEALLRRLCDPADARTPLHLKMLEHQRPGGAAFVMLVGRSDHHRTDGWACGASAGPTRPLSKLFGDDDDR
jgi:hypothetical protein